jgi:hypothetical protein
MKQWFSVPMSASRKVKRLDAAMDQRLRASVTPPEEAPPWLHASIMNAVRQSATMKPEPGRRFRLAWALPVVLVALLAGWFWLRPSIPQGGEMASGVTTDSPLPGVAWQGAALMVQPLDEELTNLTRDWERTREFLLASLP